MAKRIDKALLRRPGLSMTLKGKTTQLGLLTDVAKLKAPTAGLGKTAGAVIEGYDLRKTGITIAADNVTLRNCAIGPTVYYGVTVNDGVKGYKILNCLLDGERTDNKQATMIRAGAGSEGEIIGNVGIDTPTDMIEIAGSAIITRNALVGTGYATGAHADVVTVHGNSGPVRIFENYIDVVNDPGQKTGSNACIKIVAHFGPISNVSAEDNVLIGGGYNVYANNDQHQLSNVALRRNAMGLGTYGDGPQYYLYPANHGSGFSFEGNVSFGSAPDDLVKVVIGAAPSPGVPVTPPAPAPAPAPVPSPAPAPTQLIEAPATLRGPRTVLFMPWVSPVSDEHRQNQHEVWAKRGCNALLGVGDGQDPEAHHASAKRLGLLQIREARPGKLDEDMRDPTVIAFSTSEEPSNINPATKQPWHSPEAVLAMQQPYRDAMKRLGIEKPLFLNNVGNHIWHKNSREGLRMRDYLRTAPWQGADTYQRADGNPNLLSQDGFCSTYQGHILKWMRELMGHDGALLSIIQLGQFEVGKPVPTIGEMITQLWSSMVNDASMIGLFTSQFTPVWDWDNTAPDMADALTREIVRVKAIAPVLIDSSRGGTRPGKIWRSAIQGVAPLPDQLPWPFEARQIAYDGKMFWVVVNLSNAAATLTSTVLGVSGVKFGPHDVKFGPEKEWAGVTVPTPAPTPTPKPSPSPTPQPEPAAGKKLTPSQVTALKGAAEAILAILK